MQSSSFAASDYFDISTRNKKHFKVCTVCKGCREWTICLFLHVCFQGLSLGSCRKRWGKKQSMPRNNKGNTRQEHICWCMLLENCTLGEKGDTQNIDPIIFLTSKPEFNLDRKLPFLGGKILLCSLCTLYIDYRQYLPQCNTHLWPPQLSMEVIYRNFCEPPLTSFLQSKEHMQLKVKRVMVPITKLPHWAMQGKTAESLPWAVFCSSLASLHSPRPACCTWLAGSFSIKCLKLVPKFSAGKQQRQADSGNQQQVHVQGFFCFTCWLTP